MINLKLKIYKLFLTFILSIILTLFSFSYFSNILNAKSVSINIGFHNINLYPENKVLWFFIKKIYIYSQMPASFIISHYLFSMLFSNFINKNKQETSSLTNNNFLHLLVGKDINNSPIIIPEKGLYQNILITGSIGSGKTSSAMYPFTKQLIAYSHNKPDKKIGMLILDVKGNYYQKVLEYANEYNRTDDIIVIQINGPFKYNPLNKPELKASVIANQLKTILTLFSPNNSESYWIDKAEEVLREAIKLCRLYNSNYVTFEEIHKLITHKDFYLEKVNSLRTQYLNNNLSKPDIYNLLSSLNFFTKEFFALDPRTLNILKSEITRITNCFISDYDVTNTFCPKECNLNFKGFTDVINYGKIVVLNMNINEYRNLSKIIAAYLKIDFQTAVMLQLSKSDKNIRTTAFISDEYSEYVTANDANFFSQSRESKCINIISTQSYTSLLNTLNNQYSTKVIIHNLVNKIWFRNDDNFTIEDAQKQLRKNRKRTYLSNIFRKCQNNSIQLFF